MRNILLVVGVAGLIGLFSACGGSDKPPNAQEGGATSNGGSTRGGAVGRGGSIGKGGSIGAGGAGGNESSDPLAPTVTITFPTEVDDPNQDGVLSGSDVTVTCTV